MVVLPVKLLRFTTAGVAVLIPAEYFQYEARITLRSTKQIRKPISAVYMRHHALSSNNHAPAEHGGKNA